MKRSVYAGCFVATAGALAVTALDCAWWFLLGTRGRAFVTELDRYFADELVRLRAALAEPVDTAAA